MSGAGSVSHKQSEPHQFSSVSPHRRMVADLSIFYDHVNGNCSLEIRDIIPDPVRHV